MKLLTLALLTLQTIQRMVHSVSRDHGQFARGASLSFNRGSAGCEERPLQYSLYLFKSDMNSKAAIFYPFIVVTSFVMLCG